MPTAHRTAELYVRSLAPRQYGTRLDEALSVLDRLEATGELEETQTRVWGAALPTNRDHPLTNRLAVFRNWAEENDATLVGIEERPVGTLVDETRTVWVLPTLVLAEYAEEELVCVTPHERDGVFYSIEDRLGALDDSDSAMLSAPELNSA